MTAKSNVITIDLPGKFDNFFSGSSVGQGQFDGSYPGGECLYKAYMESKRITRGKGYSLRLTIPVDEHTRDVLDCLRDYGETCISANKDSTGSDNEPEVRSDAYGEIAAGRKVCERVDAALKGLDA
jgi:hypothetical protein